MTLLPARQHRGGAGSIFRADLPARSGRGRPGHIWRCRGAGVRPGRKRQLRTR